MHTNSITDLLLLVNQEVECLRETRYWVNTSLEDKNRFHPFIES